MERYVFLDVDGVLNSMADFAESEDSGKELFEEHIERLSRIVLPDAQIILSSTWRSLYGDEHPTATRMIKTLDDSLEAYGMYISDITEIISYKRPLEIWWYLKRHNLNREDVKFVILDDDFQKEDYDKYRIGEHLVQTRYFCNHTCEGGIQEEHVKAAYRILGR